MWPAAAALVVWVSLPYRTQHEASESVDIPRRPGMPICVMALDIVRRLEHDGSMCTGLESGLAKEGAAAAAEGVTLPAAPAGRGGRRCGCGRTRGLLLLFASAGAVLACPPLRRAAAPITRLRHGQRVRCKQRILRW